jgi:hypothetical protein
MRLSKVKQTTGFQEVGDDLRPTTDVRQPPDRSPGDEHRIERRRLGDCRRRVIEVRVNEAGSVGEAQLFCEPTSGKDRGWQEIQSHDCCPALRKSQRIGAEMTLKVQDTYLRC